MLSLANLLGYRQSPGESPAAGPPGIAVNTPPGGKCAIPVGTGKPGINRYLLNPATIEGSQIGVEIVVSFVHDNLLWLDHAMGRQYNQTSGGVSPL